MFEGEKACRNCSARIWAVWNRCPYCGELAGRHKKPLAINQDSGWSERWPNKPAAVVVIDKVDPRFWRFKGFWGECWLGPINDLVGWGSSPYMDWYNECFYMHVTARSN